MLDQVKVTKAINYILEGCTIKETHENTGYSERSIQNYIKALNDKSSNVYNPLLYQKVRLQQEKTARERNRLGGTLSTYSSSVSMSEKIEMANIVLVNDFTIEKASAYFGIPASTLYEYLISIDNKEILNQLKALFAHHKQVVFNQKVNKQ